MNKYILSILIPSLKSRHEKLAVLREHLREQSQKVYASLGLAVETRVFTDDGEATSGHKRQHLVNGADGEYICFVDDDDRVADDYVVQIVSAIGQAKPDVITFKVEGPQGEWEYVAGVEDNRPSGIMAANHLCVWRADLARTIGWCPYLGYGDDQLWYKAMNTIYTNPISTSLDKVLYHYLYSPKETVNQDPAHTRIGYEYGSQGVGLYWLDNEYYMESKVRHNTDLCTSVINSRGTEVTIPQFYQRATKLTTIQIK